jgi:hypothetical protein
MYVVLQIFKIINCTKVRWERRLQEPLPDPSSPFGGVYTIIDGFPCYTNAPSDCQESFYSGKYQLISI